MRFIFPHSHAFNGGQLTVEDDGPSGSSCLVAFGDGTTIVGELAGAAHDGYRIEVPAYRTARGNAVSARTWHIVRHATESVWRSMRAG